MVEGKAALPVAVALIQKKKKGGRVLMAGTRQRWIDTAGRGLYYEV